MTHAHMLPDLMTQISPSCAAHLHGHSPSTPPHPSCPSHPSHLHRELPLSGAHMKGAQGAAAVLFFAVASTEVRIKHECLLVAGDEHGPVPAITYIHVCRILRKTLTPAITCHTCLTLTPAITDIPSWPPSHIAPVGLQAVM